MGDWEDEKYARWQKRGGQKRKIVWMDEGKESNGKYNGVQVNVSHTCHLKLSSSLIQDSKSEQMSYVE